MRRWVKQPMKATQRMLATTTTRIMVTATTKTTARCLISMRIALNITLKRAFRVYNSNVVFWFSFIYFYCYVCYRPTDLVSHSSFHLINITIATPYTWAWVGKDARASTFASIFQTCWKIGVHWCMESINIVIPLEN